MRVKELIPFLKDQDQNREVVLHVWTGDRSVFKQIIPAATPEANSKNLFCFIEHGILERVPK